ncbi:MFS transporter [Amycolatopsis anabasis]|uniref:MFS transporter n=1 Tax=Amycolatopsis anabasis TaxID=1840409 RepID=UPI001FE94359|nr:MFS transporter [Amycolatopsis anabasis]
MALQSYRRVLGRPGVRTSMLLMFFARLPITAMGITLTLHVVSDLGRGYGAAGLVGTATTLGSALGAPLVGRMIDRYGLRPVTAVCAAASTAYWLSAAHLPYAALLVAALPAGVLAVPAGSIARQVLAALVPAEGRRAAYSLDTVSVEMTFMIGPAVGILVSTQVSSTVALSSIGVCFALAGIALWWTNPPVRGQFETVVAHTRPPLRTWLTARLTGTLLVAVGALFVLVGMELAMLAALRESGEVTQTGVLFVVICLASLIGGLVHGAVRRSLPQLTLMLLLTLLTIPVGLFDHPWWLLALALIPSNLACAPTIAATTESVSALAPARVRGEAMGLQDSATRAGLALGSPVVGFVIDRSSAAWGFVAAGGGGLLFAVVAVVLFRWAATRAPATAGSVA